MFIAVITGQFIEIITLFGIVIIHELGHVFAAISYGWKVEEIELLPFGGVAKINQTMDSIWAEMIVAVAGPFQNLMMIIVAYTFQEFAMWSDNWTTFFIQANIWIGLFNLLPVSPLDGYKVLKGFLFLLFSYRKAVMVSIFISIVVIIFFLIWASGLLYGMKVNINGMILLLFFIYNNWIEIKQAPYQFWRFLFSKLDNKPKRNIKAVPLIVHQDTLIIHALRLLSKERYHLFYLMSNEGDIIKVLPEERVLKTLFNEKELYQPIQILAI